MFLRVSGGPLGSLQLASRATSVHRQLCLHNSILTPCCRKSCKSCRPEPFIAVAAVEESDDGPGDTFPEHISEECHRPSFAACTPEPLTAHAAAGGPDHGAGNVLPRARITFHSRRTMFSTHLLFWNCRPEPLAAGASAGEQDDSRHALPCATCCIILDCSQFQLQTGAARFGSRCGRAR